MYATKAVFLVIATIGFLPLQVTRHIKFYKPHIVIARDGNAFVFAASTGSRDGDIVNAISSNDVWIVKIDGAGNMLWRKNFGGTEYEGASYCILVNPDKTYTVSAYTASNNIDVPSTNRGLYDGWLFKFRY